jgi:intracellular septation protein
VSNFLYAARPFFDDFIYTIVFVALVAAGVDVAIATGLVSGLGVAYLVSMKLRGKPVARMQWVGLGLVLVFGGASLLTRDPRFILFKPTLVYLAVGFALAKPGWMARYMPPIAKGRIPARLVDGAGFVWCGLMFATALVNLGLVMFAEPKTWAMVMGSFPLASKLALFLAQYAVFNSVGRRRARAMAAQPG